MENRISFSANASGVVLLTKHGELSFTAAEFACYQHLFKILDTGSQEALSTSNGDLMAFLVRCDAPRAVIEKALAVVTAAPSNGHSHGSGSHASHSSSLDFNAWLMLCKLLAYHQATKRDISAHSLRDLPRSAIAVPQADFHLTSLRRDFAAGRCYRQFTVEVAGWALHGEAQGYGKQVAKFRLLVRRPQEKEQTQAQELAVERRYSEFETLVSILHKHYRGSVVPPLPPKHWDWPLPLPLPLPLGAPDPQQQQLRAADLQRFLDDLLAHPALSQAHELQAFLSASAAGLRSCTALYLSLLAEEAQSPPHEGAGPQGDAQGLLGRVTQMASSVGQRGLGLWGSLASALLPAAAAPSASALLPAPPAVDAQDHGLQVQLIPAKRTLELLATAGKRLQRLLQDEGTQAEEMGRMALGLRALGDCETVPEAVRCLRRVHGGLEAAGRVAQESLLRCTSSALGPLLFNGRYSDSLRLALEGRQEQIKALQQAARREEELRRATLDLQVEVDQAAAAHAIPIAPRPISGYSDQHAEAEADEVGARERVETEAKLNALKLAQAEAEDRYEEMKADSDQAALGLLEDCVRLPRIQRQRMAGCMAALIRDKAAAHRAQLLIWEDLRRQLLS